MLTFNLVEKDWIPVQLLDGSFTLMSLTDVFLKAHDIRDIAANTPIEHISLLRFLQAFVIRIFNVDQDEEAWFEIWNHGGFSKEKTVEYLDKWKHRLDLFDKDKPFYQVTALPKESYGGISYLFMDWDLDKEQNFFFHFKEEEPTNIAVSQLAVSLITTQSNTFGIGRGHKSTPFIKGIIFWVTGDNLFRSLLLNSMKYYGSDRSGKDVPIWEKNKAIVDRDISVTGYLEYLTIQSKRLNILLSDDLGFKNRILSHGEIQFYKNNDYAMLFRAQGEAISGEDEFYDPLMCYNKTDKGFKTMQINSEKSIWRDSGTFLNINDKQIVNPPRNLEFLAENYNVIGIDNVNVDIYALDKGPRKIKLWLHESFPFYPIIAKDNNRYEVVNELLNWANNQNSKLYNSLKVLAVLYVSPNRIPDFNTKDYDLKKISKITLINEEKAFLSSLSAERIYWSMLESRFYEHMKQIALSDSDECNKIKEEWLDFLNDCAKQAFDRATANFTSNSRQLRAVTIARNYIYRVEKKQKSNDSDKNKENTNE